MSAALSGLRRQKETKTVAVPTRRIQRRSGSEKVNKSDAPRHLGNGKESPEQYGEKIDGRRGSSRDNDKGVSVVRAPPQRRY